MKKVKKYEDKMCKMEDNGNGAVINGNAFHGKGSG